MKINKTKLAQGLEEIHDFATGKNGDLRVIEVPSDINVKIIREKTKLSQSSFAKRYGFPLGTVKNWEQGRRQPEGPARLLLKLISKDPEYVQNILSEKIA